PRWRGVGASTPSQTAWALLALHAAGEGDSEEVWRGISWLVETQREDGSWDEPQFTGTGFPGDFYIKYHMYRLVFPISALGRVLGRFSWGGAQVGDRRVTTVVKDPSRKDVRHQATTDRRRGPHEPA